MDMTDKDKLELEKRNEESMSYHNPSMSTDWRYNGTNFATSSMGLVPNSNNHMVVCGDVVGPSCSTSSMADSFGPNVWDHPVNPAASLGFNELNIPSGSTSSDPLSLLKSSGLFMPSMPGMLPHSLSQFPADSAFIERAARFSSFNGGFSDMLNPFGIHSNSNPYVRAGPMMQSSQEVMPGNGMKSYHVRQPLKGEGNSGETSKDVSLPQENVSMEGCSPKNETIVDRTNDEPKQGVSISGNDSDEAGFSGGGFQQVDGTPSSANRLGPKKRKRGNQVSEPEVGNENQQLSGETGRNNVETQLKGEQSSTPPGNKSNGKNGKQNSQASDPPKEEYIHVRARRGQATNSHSLAERVRREKISERMKFLQDLVPGCSKVTGKAVMLDEIINYVQSLQRQVEFLSMKLATVNPRLDFSIERLLAKDQMFSTRAGPSSGLGFSPDMPMTYPSMHPTQPPMFQHALPAVGNSADPLRRNITSQMMNMGGGYKESAPQLPNAWDDELHNVVQMGFSASPPFENQETNGSASSPGQMKAES